MSTPPSDPSGLKASVIQHVHGLTDVPVGRGPRKVVGTDDLASTMPGEAGASMVGFDNTGSGLTADTVQDALDELVASGAGFHVETSEWSDPLTGVTPGLQQFNQTLTVPAGTVPPGRTLEITMSIAAQASSDHVMDLQVNGVSLFAPGGYPLQLSAGFWPETWVARVTNAGPAAGAPWGNTDTLITNQLALLVDPGTGAENVIVNFSNTPIGAPGFDPAAELTITAHWRNALVDGTAYLRHLSARLL